jgi:hypothetical protein
MSAAIAAALVRIDKTRRMIVMIVVICRVHLLGNVDGCLSVGRL